MVRLFRKSARFQEQPFQRSVAKEFILGLLAQSNCWCYSVDFRTGQYIYLSSGMQRLLGYDYSAWHLKGLCALFECLHPSDREKLRCIHQEMLRALHEIAVHQRKDLSFTYLCRMNRVDGHEVLMSLHSVFVDFDAAGEPLSDFTIVADVTALQPSDTSVLAIGQLTTHGELPVRTIHLPQAEGDIHFTRRELEVLCLVAEGLNSTDIGQRLFVSYHTVPVGTGEIFCTRLVQGERSNC